MPETIAVLRSRTLGLLATAAPNAARYLRDVSTEQAKGTTYRIGAAKFILDHVIGKPMQRLEVVGDDGAVGDNFGRYTEHELRDMIQSAADKDKLAAVTKQNALDKLAIESTAQPVGDITKGTRESITRTRDNSEAADNSDNTAPLIITESMRYLWADSRDKREIHGDDMEHNVAAISSD